MISVITPSIRPEGLKIVQNCLQEQDMNDFEWLVEIGLPKTGHDLNKAFNKMLKRARGELVVFYQDYIKIKENGLSTFWAEYKKRPDYFLTAPVGKTLEYEAEAQFDWRKGNYKDVDFAHWEIDWGSAPLSALKEIGGFDEELDKYWSCDNPNVGCRADLAGYKFANIDNIAVAIDHDKIETHPFRQNYNPQFNNQRLEQFRRGLKINYINS